MCWSAWPDTAWRTCRMPSYPNILPVDTKRYWRSFSFIIPFIERYHLSFLCWAKLKLSSSGGDPGGVEQARYWKLSSSVDHHLGHSGWFTASGSTHLRPIQGQWNKLLKILAYCHTVWWKMKVQLNWWRQSSFLISAFLKSPFAVRLLQAIATLRHRHGESTAQTAGCLWGLDDNQSHQNHSTWPYDCNGETRWNV